MSKKTNASTMKDVAREAGVALGTVSKVVNGLPVGEEYRIRVEDAIEKLNYRVNSYARGLRNSKTNVVAVLLPNLSLPFYSKLAHHIAHFLGERGYLMMLSGTDYSPVLEQEYVYMAQQQKVDGVICLSYNENLVIPEGLPFVSIDRYFDYAIPCVASDNYGGGRLAAKKLAEFGCKKVAFLREGADTPNEPNKRKDGFVSGCISEKLDYDVLYLNHGPYTAFESFLHSHFHDGKLDYDGLFCVTDTLAFRVRRTLEEMGVRIPEDVQIIGFDGIQHFGDLGYTCSTIVQPAEEIARYCVEAVLDPGKETPALVCFPVTYAYGGTTKE